MAIGWPTRVPGRACYPAGHTTRSRIRRSPLDGNPSQGLDRGGTPAGPSQTEPTPLSTREITRCLLCGAEDLEEEPFAYHFSGVEFPGARCSVCDLVFLRRQPDAAGLERLYDADYFQCDYHCGLDERPYFDTEELQTRASADLLKSIEQAVRPGRILEIGSAGGYFLKTARDRGWTPTGVEISEAASAFARERLELDIRTGTLEAARFDDAAFDAAYLGDVLEHVPEPMATLRELRRIIRPGGALLLAGPITINSIDRRAGYAIFRVLGKTKILRVPPYHLTEFTPRTLRSALVRAGFEVSWLRQSKIPPVWRNVRQRHPLEHAAKIASDAFNILFTRATGHLGDRFVSLSLRLS